MRIFKMLTADSDAVDYTNTDVIILTGRWIIGSRDNYMLSVVDGGLETSIDAGDTWAYSIAFSSFDLVLCGWIYENGNMMMVTNNNKIYFTTYELNSVVERTMFDTDGVTPYAKHTPLNSTYPGWYYHFQEPQITDNDNDIHVWGNYSNAHDSGASAINIYYTINNGLKYKVAYKFGQNPNYGDNGTATGGLGGTLLGDASNSVKTKHCHNTQYCAFNDKWYTNTGDQYWSFNAVDEIHWLEGVYNSTLDSWTWTKINFGITIQKTSRLKGTEFFFVDDYIYWGSDANPVVVADQQGIWRSKISTFDTPSTHERVLAFTNKDLSFANLKVDYNTGFVVGTVFDYGAEVWNLLIAKDFGHGEYQMKLYSGYELIRLNSPNSKGYFRLDAVGYETNQNTSFLIKAGEDLFESI